MRAMVHDAPRTPLRPADLPEPTPGDGQVRAMITLMTNPVRSAANSAQLEEAYAKLEFFVAVDFYINETTRHAHIILPTPSPSELPGYEIGLYHLSVRNVAKWSWPVLPAEPGQPETWEVLATLTPHDFLTFRGFLRRASGFQSQQYRELEYLLGNKRGDMMIVHKDDAAATARLRAAFEAPSLYDELLRLLARRGFAIPADRLERDWTRPYEASEAVEQAWLAIYTDPAQPPLTARIDIQPQPKIGALAWDEASGSLLVEVKDRGIWSIDPATGTATAVNDNLTLTALATAPVAGRYRTRHQYCSPCTAMRRSARCAVMGRIAGSE